MTSKRRLATSKGWQAADHKFAVATMALMIFLFVVGLANWLLDGGKLSLPQTARAREPRQATNALLKAGVTGYRR